MDPFEITYQLRKNGTSQAEIARKLKITRTAVCMIVKGRGESKRVKKAIAKAIKMKISEIWPKVG